MRIDPNRFNASLLEDTIGEILRSKPLIEELLMRQDHFISQIYGMGFEVSSAEIESIVYKLNTHKEELIKMREDYECITQFMSQILEMYSNPEVYGPPPSPKRFY